MSTRVNSRFAPKKTAADASPVSAVDILDRLQRMGSRRNVAGMARFGIVSPRAYGVSAPKLRALARSIGRDHRLALDLWSSGVLEARILAALVDDPELVTERQMERWARDVDNWAVCDACCGVLFDKTPFAVGKAITWSRRREEFVKRGAFSLMAALAVHDKKMSDDVFLEFLPIIEEASDDSRNFVRKGVNWALRQIGKRNEELRAAACETARRIRQRDTSSARWIAGDALRELNSPAVRARLLRRRKSTIR